ncbi:MAG: WD40 repeat domain-containing protein [Verrucomicrobia bacterium]|nr:WD40 repeat domain-containing protein [Verrucomicrobiota bacterium]
MNHRVVLLLASFAGAFARLADAAPVTGLAFSPDSAVLAVASGQSVSLRNAATGRESTSVSCGKERALALSFQPNGPLLAVGTGIPGERGGVRLLDWRRQAWLGSLSTNRDVVTSVAFSPDGQSLATTSADGSATLHRIESNGAKLTAAFPLIGHSAAVQAVAFSPDGGILVTASMDRSLKVWSAADGRLLRSFGQHTDAVLALAFRPVVPDRADASPYCASGGDDRTVRVWQPSIGRMVRIVRQHDGPVLALAYTPDGRFLFSSGQEGFIRCIDADSDEVLGQWRASADWIYSLSVSPDGRTLAAGNWAGAVGLWELTGSGLRMRYEER